MGSGSKIFLCCHGNKHLLVSLLFLLVSYLTLFMVIEGKPLTNLFHSTHKGTEQGKKTVAMMRAQIIGSRPPKCERRCRKCGHCEAVQVPIVTTHSAHLHDPLIPKIQYSRGDDVSNYKPMSWKCKCGNMIFDP